MHYIEQVLKKDPKNFEALTLKSILQLSQHHFSEALETAQKAKQINPHNAYVYGLMIDAYVEMGNYKKAVENSDEMVSIRPDIRSYSRISYLREIHGDYPGAVEAMKMAVESGAYVDEPTAWARIQLARLYECTGDLKSAEMHYTIALNERPEYAYAIAGLGSIAVANKDYNKAIAQYIKADTLVTDYAFKEKLAELYLLTGQQKKANELTSAIIKQLTEASKEGEGSINHHADKELAFVYLLVNKNAAALKHALAEYNRRPDNIDVAETVAWTYFKNGEVQNAIPFIETALRTGSKNPVLLCHAGIIYAASGNKQKSQLLLSEALKNNPNIDPALKEEARKILNKL
jgi:tetratricopeptide (TPR) repeat protein